MAKLIDNTAPGILDLLTAEATYYKDRFGMYNETPLSREELHLYFKYLERDLLAARSDLGDMLIEHGDEIAAIEHDRDRFRKAFNVAFEYLSPEQRMLVIHIAGGIE